MKATRLKIERLFILGRGPKDAPHETATFTVEWQIEDDETIAECEERAIIELYQMAERERKRRWGYLEALMNEKRAREKAREEHKPQAPIHTIAPSL